MLTDDAAPPERLSEIELLLLLATTVAVLSLATGEATLTTSV
ncbi:hypothetical protein [Serratia proteamaculans]